MVVRFRLADGRVSELDPEPGESLMELAVRHGLDGIVGECGGFAVCGTCHVTVPAEHRDRLPEPSAEEDQTLDTTAVPRGPGSRLACQVDGAAARGIEVIVAERQY